ncbi:MAG: pyridoxal phosphate-dependent aminotransferase [Syntrophales bacterium]
MKELSPFIAMDILEKAQEMERRGERIIHLELGEPDFDTPRCIKEAGCRAIQGGKTHYTHSLGLFELREAVCEHYFGKYGITVTPNRVFVASGTSAAMVVMFSALIGSGDEVIIPDPYYSCYPNFISFFDAVPVKIDTLEEEGFQPDPAAVKAGITARTKAVLINSPSNPAGTLMEAEKMSKIAALGIPVISDEIYHGLVYEGRERTILEFTPDAFVLNGFSKTYAMTGWRLGYVIAPAEFIRPMQKVQQNLFISANAFVQWAGIAALREAEADVKKMRDIYNERRKYMVRRLRGMGIGVAVEPKGAFYVMGNCRDFSRDSYSLALDILSRAGVAVTPGIDFGRNGEGYLRLSYANSMENIREGLDRLENYLRNLKK